MMKKKKGQKRRNSSLIFKCDGCTSTDGVVLERKGKFGANTFENGWAEYVILLVLASPLIKRADLNYGLTSYASTH